MEVVRKDIRNLHLAVYPPAGRVRIAVPNHIGDDAVRLAVIDRLAWIRREQERFAAQPRQPERRYVSGESHYHLGKRYNLEVDEIDAPPRVSFLSKTKMHLSVRPGATIDMRREVLERWYRSELREVVAPLVESWQSELGVEAADWKVRHMRTKWGSCGSDTRRILFNTELAKKPVPAVEYIVVHELVHLLERGHGERFTAILDEHLPDWRQRRDLLNAAPLAHENWSY